MREPRPWPIDAPEMRSPKVTLIFVQDGIPFYANRVGEKRDMVEQTEGPLWATWRGEHTTDVFSIERAQAELEVCSGPDRSRRIPPDAAALLEWFTEQAAKQGFLSDHTSYATPEVTAAKKLSANFTKQQIAAVAQFALTDDRKPFGWRGNVLSVSSLHHQWNRLVAEWERADCPRYDPSFVYREGDDASTG